MSEQQPLSLVDAHNADGMCWCIVCGTDRLQAGVAREQSERREAKRIASAAKRARDAKAMPLRAANGVIYAYACGLCHHVAGGSAMLGRPDVPGPIAMLVADSLRDALSCCACRSCGSPTDRSSRCDACYRWLRFGRAWFELGNIIKRGFETLHEYKAWLASDDEDDS